MFEGVSGGSLNWVLMMPREVSLSDLYSPDCLKYTLLYPPYQQYYVNSPRLNIYLA